DADGGDGAHGGFASGTGAFDTDFSLAESVAHRLTAGILGNHLRGVSGALAAALEAHLAGAAPAKHVAAVVGDADDRVIESGQHVDDAAGNVLGALGLDDLRLVLLGIEQGGDGLFGDEG